MALKYVVKKRVFGFDKTKTEKYVAQNVITNTVNFRDLCKDVSMFGMIPEGAVKHVIDALIDALNTNLNKGLSVQLGDFGCFRPGMSCKSQKEEKDVDADTVRLFLKSIGEDPEREGLVETPDRIARACRELFAGLQASPADVLEKHFDVDTDELVLVKDIELYSVCEHHLLPFHGVDHVGYIPAKDGVMGLSKLARLVEVYARRPQVQERLTQQIADALVEYAGARGVIVVTECEHLCMSMRGIKKSSARTVTSAVRGLLRNPATRAEAMSLILDK